VCSMPKRGLKEMDGFIVDRLVLIITKTAMGASMPVASVTAE
jgi:hypothetical protein